MVTFRAGRRFTPIDSLYAISSPRPRLLRAPQALELRTWKLTTAAMLEPQDYSQWSHEQLQERIKTLDARLEHLEKQLAKFDHPALRPLLENADYVASGTSSLKLPEKPKPKVRSRNPRSERDFDSSKYSSRLIALKFAYLGQNYNGFEYHPNNTTPLPTVEETLWKALMKARLIFPTPNPAIVDGEPNFDGCEYSKCGRTDKSVSAFGQVIGIRVRSNRPLSRLCTPLATDSNGVSEENDDMATHQMELASPSLREIEMGGDRPTSTSTMSLDEETLSFHPIHDEIPYSQVLNRLLPPDIRILAWCPAPPLDFSARFSCKERHYTYFFTQPAFTPNPSKPSPFNGPVEGLYGKRREGYLNIHVMREAARKFKGLHDFRNFCKVDASKQIDNFQRRIFHAGIEELSCSNLPAAYVSDPNFEGRELDKDEESPFRGGTHDEGNTGSPKLYAFNLHGNAFLWHQVRHMVAILFLIGQGLENPTLIDDLLNITKMPTKPQYEMADAAPLVLWNCIFPREGADSVDSATGRRVDAMEWVHVGDDAGRQPELKKGTGKTDGKFGFGGVVDDLWRVWRGRKIDEVLAGVLLNVVVRQGNNRDMPGGGGGVVNHLKGIRGKKGGDGAASSQKVFQGGDGPKYTGVYVPVLHKPRMEAVEVINERYREKKGFVTREEVKAEGWRSVPLEKTDGECG